MENSMVNSVITKRDRDCLACRLTSGFGLIGAGIYLYSMPSQTQAKKIAIYASTSVLIFLGTTRTLDIWPFQDRFKRKE